MGMNGAGGAAAEGCSPGGPHRAERRAGDGDALSRPTVQPGSLRLPRPASPPQAAVWSPPWAPGQGGRGSVIQLGPGAGCRGRGPSRRCSGMESQEGYERWGPRVRQAVSPISHARGRKGDTSKLGSHGAGHKQGFHCIVSQVLTVC